MSYTLDFLGGSYKGFFWGSMIGNFRVYRIQGLRFWVYGVGVQGFECRIQGLGFRDWGLGFGIRDLD